MLWLRGVSIDIVFSSDTHGRSSSIRNLVCPMFSTVQKHWKILSPAVLKQVSTHPKYSPHSLLNGQFQHQYWQADLENYHLTSEFLNGILYSLSSPTALKKRAVHNFVLSYSKNFNIKYADSWCFYLFICQLYCMHLGNFWPAIELWDLFISGKIAVLCSQAYNFKMQVRNKRGVQVWNNHII